MFTEPHSTKQIEDCVGWGHEIGAETLVDTERGPPAVPQPPTSPEQVARADVPGAGRPRRRRLVRPYAEGEALAELTGGSLVTVAGGGHGPTAATRCWSTG